MDTGPSPSKRARLARSAELPRLNLAAKVKEALYWGSVAYGHPARLLPPPPELARAGGIPAREAAAFPAMPPSIAAVLRRWVQTNPVYGTAALQAEEPALDETDRLDLVRQFIAAIPKRMRQTPLAPELATVAHDNDQLALGRRYGTDDAHVVPSCCNGQACASLKIQRSFGTPLQRYYTPAEDAKLQQDPALVPEFGGGPCLICLRHDVETLVRCSDGRTSDPQATYGQPYVVMLRVYNMADVPGGYRSDAFSSTPIESPDVSPIPIVAARTSDISWQYANGSWYVDQRALVWSPGPSEPDF
jgi:hypothetical protein